MTSKLREGDRLPPPVVAALQTAQVDRDEIRLVGQLDRDTYLLVDQVLRRLAGGGQYVNRARKHTYDGRNPAPELAAVVASGLAPPDPKQTAGWFATPVEWADEVVLNHAISGVLDDEGATGWRPRSDWWVLEPSAGDGALADSLRKWGCEPVCVEPVSWRAAVLRAKNFETVETTLEDWAADNCRGVWDLIVMNPPFTLPGDKLAYISHVQLAWQLVRPGGRLTAICPGGLTFRTDKRTSQLRELVKQHGDWGGWRELPEASFAASGTNVAAVVIGLNKPLEAF